MAVLLVKLIHFPHAVSREKLRTDTYDFIVPSFNILLP